MTPQEFLDEIVTHNIDDFKANICSLRLAHNAVSSLDALAAHIFWWLKKNGTTLTENDDSAYRNELAKHNNEFSLLRDIAKAQKHVFLDRHNPQVNEAKQIESRTVGWGEGGFGQGRFGGVLQVVVTDNNNTLHFIEEIVDSSLDFLKSEMQKHGLNS